MSKRPINEGITARIKEFTRWDVIPSGSDYTESYTNEWVYLRTYSGGVTPNFRNVKRLPFNAYNLVIERRTPTYLTHQKVVSFSEYAHPSIAGKSYSTEVQRYWAVGQNFSAASGHNALAEAACSKKLQSSFSKIKFNAGVFFGERQQTINLIRNNANRIVQAVRDLRKFRLGGVMHALGMVTPPKGGERAFWRRHGGRYTSEGKLRRQLNEKDLASAWLEIQYGWRPLLTDVYGVAELLGSRIRADEFSNTVRSSASVVESFPSPYYNYRTFPPSQEVSCAVTKRKTTCKYFAQFRTTNETLAAFATTGLTNPLLIAWELVPFSFIVDWFLPVGNFVEQLTAYNGFEFTSINRVQFSSGSVVVKGAIPGYSSGDSISTLTVLEGAVKGTYECVTYTRDSIAAPAFIPLEFKSPVSPTHCLNAIALLTAVFSGRKT